MVNQNLNITVPLRTKFNQMDWGSMEWLVDDSLFSGADMSVALMILSKGEMAPCHSHPNCHEFIYLIEGNIEQTLGEEKRTLKAGDSVLIPAGTAHGSRNIGSEDARMMISYSSGTRKYETS